MQSDLLLCSREGSQNEGKKAYTVVHISCLTVTNMPPREEFLTLGRARRKEEKISSPRYNIPDPLVASCANNL